jgi:hypothetical protein
VSVLLDITDISTNVEPALEVQPPAQIGQHANVLARQQFISHKAMFASNVVVMHSQIQTEQDVNVKQVLDQNKEFAYPLKIVSSMNSL